MPVQDITFVNNSLHDVFSFYTYLEKTYFILIIFLIEIITLKGDIRAITPHFLFIIQHVSNCKDILVQR